jgi:hypothetical protein
MAAMGSMAKAEPGITSPYDGIAITPRPSARP